MSKATLDHLHRAIKALHRAGFTHADLHEGNVMVTRDGKVKLVDFGAARFATEERMAWNLENVVEIRDKQLGLK